MSAPLPDWLVERGIGEERWVCLAGNRITDARIHLDGGPRAGTAANVRILKVRPQAIASDGTREYLLPGGAGKLPEGASATIEVTREPIPGPEPWKRALGRVVEAGSAASPSVDAEVLPFPSPDDRLEEAGWSDLLEEARSGLVGFLGGTLRVHVTPAMTLIDVDGTGRAQDIALAASKAVAATIRRHNVGGSIGVDFPTVAGKDVRAAIAELIDAGLGKPFERTAVNGFGFLQIVRPRRHPSLFEVAADRPAFEARALLRRAARHVGAVRLTCHPAVAAALRPEWLDALARQVGGAVSLREEAGLAISGGHVS